ncbi:MAG: dihydrofolate reductase [Acidobacteriota bacterium]
MKPHLSIIAAVAANGVIGNNGDLPWHLPADLARFKRLTMGHHLIMGRRTFDSIGGPLPGRTSVVMTRDPDWSRPGVLVAHSPAEACRVIAHDDEPFVIGGAAIFALFLPAACRLYLTRVHADVAGDVTFPPFTPADWNRGESTFHDADADHAFAFSFEVYERTLPAGPA